MAINTPILVLTFNRPIQVQRLINLIADLKADSIYFSIDGPRLGNTDDIQNIKSILRIINNFKIATNINIKIRQNPKNLGCGKAISTGITWFFSEVQEGIILEDDCIPNLSFFNFCDTLLSFYRDNHKIMHISGSNFQFKEISNKDSYYYSEYPHIWGWATWKRAWDKYDFHLDNYSLKDILYSNCNKYVRYNLIKQLISNKNNSWSFQWTFVVNANNGICITPYTNLVRNVGYDTDEATNTLIKPKWFNKMHYGETLKINHPNAIVISYDADNNLTHTVHHFNFLKFILSFSKPYIFKILKLIKTKFPRNK